MKLVAAVPVLNEWRFVPAVVGQLLQVVERCVIMRPSRSQSGAPVKLSDIPPLDPRVDILEGNWGSEAETRNAGAEYFADADYVFMLDSDEIMTDRDLERLRDLCLTGRHRTLAVRLWAYWKTPSYRIDPPENGTVKVVLRRGVRMTGVREVREPGHDTDIWCHHLSYVRTDAEIVEKIRLSGHAGEIRPEWHERVWKEWDKNPAMENLHPVHPSAYRRAVKVEDNEVGRILAKWGCGWE